MRPFTLGAILMMATIGCLAVATGEYLVLFIGCIAGCFLTTAVLEILDPSDD